DGINLVHTEKHDFRLAVYLDARKWWRIASAVLEVHIGKAPGKQCIFTQGLLETGNVSSLTGQYAIDPFFRDQNAAQQRPGQLAQAHGNGIGIVKPDKFVEGGMN